MKKLTLLSLVAGLLVGCAPTSQNPQIAKIEAVPSDQLYKASVDFLSKNSCTITLDDPARFNLGGSCGGASRIFRINITSLNTSPRLIYNFQADLKTQYEQHMTSFVQSYYK